MRISDWSSDVCSSDLFPVFPFFTGALRAVRQSRQQQQGDDVGDLDHRIHRRSRRVLVGIADRVAGHGRLMGRSEEHTSELQSLMRISYAVFCLKKKKKKKQTHRILST